MKNSPPKLFFIKIITRKERSMNNLEVFNFESKEVRTLLIDNEPWFIGKEVTEILGYSNTRDAINKHVDEEDKTVILKSQNATLEIPNRGLTIVNESGLYSLILSSKLPSAKRFKKFVTSEVLPSLRKHGMYATEETIDKILSNPDFGIRLLSELKEEREKTKILKNENEQLKPKALFADTVSASDTSILIGQLAKLLKQNGNDIGQNRLFKILRKDGYLGKSGENYNLPTQKSMNLKVMEIKERTVNNSDGSVRITKTPMITGKGQVYFVNKYKEI